MPFAVQATGLARSYHWHNAMSLAIRFFCRPFHEGFLHKTVMSAMDSLHVFTDIAPASVFPNVKPIAEAVEERVAADMRAPADRMISGVRGSLSQHRLAARGCAVCPCSQSGAEN